MDHHRHRGVFREALPIAGRDGTLRQRMKGTAAEGNVIAKTGTLGRVCTLSGYVTSAAQEHLVFSLMLNNDDLGTDPARVEVDALAVMLAELAEPSSRP
jgi:D-alanyl-D-alanine carboxypeptidase/D-alanyl-D-alanine-endopeptidase (penicillin-binding protein 4)